MIGMKTIILLLLVCLGFGLLAVIAPLRAQDPAKEKPAVAATKTAIFAGGCFWCMQPSFDNAEGVTLTRVGFSGGTTPDPTYEEVSQGGTGHMEVIAVTYDPAKISYAQLLDIFWRTVDPTDDGGQFCDRGSQYTSAVFYNDEAEKKAAEESKMLIEADDERLQGKPVVTKILPAAPFYAADESHQTYYKKNPIRYKFYRSRCGRDERLKEVWGEGAGTH